MLRFNFETIFLFTSTLFILFHLIYTFIPSSYHPFTLMFLSLSLFCILFTPISFPCSTSPFQNSDTTIIIFVSFKLYFCEVLFNSQYFVVVRFVSTHNFLILLSHIKFRFPRFLSVPVFDLVYVSLSR